MKIFNYSPITGEFLSESEADESPLEPGVYLIPANATKICPTAVKENEVACFDKELKQWKIKPDFRGKTYFDKETERPVIIDFIGDIPENLVLELPINIEKLKAEKLAENNKAISEKLYFNTSVGDLGLHTIAGTLATVMGNYFGLNLPDYTGMLFTYEGEEIPNLAKENFINLYQEVLQKYLAFDAKTRKIKNDINAATSKEELELITIDYSNL